MVVYQASGKTYEAEDIKGIVRQLQKDNEERNKGKRHRPYSTDYGTLFNQVSQAITKAMAPKVQREMFHAEQPRPERVSFKDALNGAKAIVSLAAGNITTDAEMKRRATICGQCPLLTTNTDCAGCKMGQVVTQAANWVRGLAKRNIIYPTFNNVYGKQAKDLSCGYCGCSMLTMLPAKMKAFRENDEKNQARPDMCWIKRGGQNHVEES